MARTIETFQISAEVAETYEARFVPRLFAPWARHTVDAAALRPGERVLDVACGTGAVAREAAARVGAGGAVLGVDLNENMLEVARRIRPDLEWRQADAGGLPLPDRAFDAVLCQSALMFFPDPRAALAEMARVAVPGGRVVVQVWATLDAQPVYGPFVEVAARHAGPDAVRLLGTYWSMGDLGRLGGLFDEAGLEVVDTRTRTETARFDSVDELVAIEVNSTPLAERLDADTYRRIVEGSRAALASLVTPSGALEAPLVGHLVAARPR